MNTKRPTPLTDAAKSKYLAGALPITDIFQPMAELESRLMDAREQRTHAERVCVDALAKRDQAERDRDAAREQRDALRAECMKVLKALTETLPFGVIPDDQIHPDWHAARALLTKLDGGT